MARRQELLMETKKQLLLMGPLIAGSILRFLIQYISVLFVGHLGKLPLASASMASSFVMATGFSLMMGMAAALETLCGQAFGAKEYRMIGIHMQTGILVLMLVSIPIVVAWVFAGQILTAIKQDPGISIEAGLFARWMIPSLFAYGILQCQARFLQTQSIVYPQMMSSGVTTLLHILMCWALVIKFGFGSKGAAMANSISNWINVLFLGFYITLSPTCKNTWCGLSKEALYNVINFIKLAIPSAAMTCMEFWSFELLVILSGLLPNPVLETSVISISLNMTVLVYMIPMGVSAAVSTRVSNEVGGGFPHAARLAAYVALSIAVVGGIITGLVIILGRHTWGHIYSTDKEVVTYFASVMPLVALTILLDSVQTVLSGTVRGCGRQKVGAYTILGSFYLVGLPISILLAFVFHFGGKGLWIGLICALFVQALVLLLVILRTNWQKEATQTNEVVDKSTIHVDTST